MYVCDVDSDRKAYQCGRITCTLLLNKTKWRLTFSRVRNEKNRLSQIRLDGVSACTVLRPEYKTHQQKDANSFVFVIKNKREIEGAEPR